MLCNISVPQNINEINKKRSRPRIDIFLINTKHHGYLTLELPEPACQKNLLEKSFPPENRPSPLPKTEADYELKDASGNDLGLLGTYLLTFKINGRSVQHEVVVLKNLTDSFSEQISCTDITCLMMHFHVNTFSLMNPENGIMQFLPQVNVLLSQHYKQK